MWSLNARLIGQTTWHRHQSLFCRLSFVALDPSTSTGHIICVHDVCAGQFRGALQQLRMRFVGRPVKPAGQGSCFMGPTAHWQRLGRMKRLYTARFL